MDVDENKKVLRVSFPHAIFGRWFMGELKPHFERQLMPVMDGMAIIYTEEQDFQPQKRSSPHLFSGKKQESAPGDKLLGLPLTETCTFDSFLVNRKNSVALEAAKKLSASCVPLVLFGQSGSGKSHLLSAMANACRVKKQIFFYGDVEFLSAVNLTSGNCAAIREEAVFLDNAQRVFSLPGFQEALAVLIDAFCSAGKLLALGLDIHPAHCFGIQPKLLSRLSRGLVLELKRPDLDIRAQYVRQKNRALALNLDKDKVLAIAQRFSDMRSIDGVLTRMLFCRSLETHDADRAPGPDSSPFLEQEMERDFLRPAHIITVIARHFSLSPDMLVGKNRDARNSRARHIAILLCRELLGLPLMQLGRLFGGRDHSSIVYSIKKIKQLQDSDKDTHNEVELLRKLCLTKRAF